MLCPISFSCLSREPGQGDPFDYEANTEDIKQSPLSSTELTGQPITFYTTAVTLDSAQNLPTMHFTMGQHASSQTLNLGYTTGWFWTADYTGAQGAGPLCC